MGFLRNLGSYLRKCTPSYSRKPWFCMFCHSPSLYLHICRLYCLRCRIYNKISTKIPRCFLYTDNFLRLATREQSRPLSRCIMKSVPHDLPVFIIMFWHGGQEQKYEVRQKSCQHVTFVSGVLWKFVSALMLHLPARFAVVIAVFPNTKAVWDIMPCRLVNGHRRFDG
jgi:hypothetical protein